MFEESKERIVRNFRVRNINVEFFNSLEDCKGRILEIVSEEKTIGIGNSVTLKKMNILLISKLK